MFIDTHMHEMTYSKDSFLALDQMVQIARMKGLEGICITDHDSMGLKEYAAEYSKDTGFPIFVGIEYYSLQGDIVAFGIEDYPTERIPAQDFIDLVNAQAGVCFAAHPFRNNNRGLEENLQQGKGPSWTGGAERKHFCGGMARRPRGTLRNWAFSHWAPAIATCRRRWAYVQLTSLKSFIRWKGFLTRSEKGR